MDLIKIGKFIAEQRKKKKLTQEQLAEKLGINNRTISRWENGKNMPDISLYKEICEILEISVEELINGEITKDKNNIKESFEKALITTVVSNDKQVKKVNRLFKFLGVVIAFSILTITTIIIYYNKKYPKIDIYNMNVIKSEENKLNDKLTFKYDDHNIYFYGIESLQLGNIDNTYYDLKVALQYKQITIDKVKEYLDNQYQSKNIKLTTKFNNEIKIYKHNNYEVVVCNTKDNKDLYIGTTNISTKLKGRYCNKEIKEECNFTRTYKIVNLQDDDDYNYMYVTLKQYQGETTQIKIKRNNDLKEGKNYEFTFATYEEFEDNINNIFQYSEIIEIKETSKLGMEQKMDKMCVN